MTNSSASLEVNIVSLSDVKRYAQQDLSRPSRGDIEQTLLDDDRAREVVKSETAPVTTDSLSEEARKNLQSCLALCKKAAISYESLSRKSENSNTLDAARGCFSVRWTLSNEIRRILGIDTDDVITIDRLESTRSAQIDSAGAAADQAFAHDHNLEAMLYSAFERQITPAWKAKTAEWIAKIQSDRGRLAWLNRTAA